MIAQGLDNADHREILEERELAGSEVIEQRTERLGPQRDLRVELPRLRRVERVGRRYRITGGRVATPGDRKGCRCGHQ
ncbi:Uncharacterised protein [Mycobacteroides abscessus subsp. abscessus]|nr:Uncharacterised protein [Mycobacteroides abscessus subsp. abscessus]